MPSRLSLRPRRHFESHRDLRFGRYLPALKIRGPHTLARATLSCREVFGGSKSAEARGYLTDEDVFEDVS
jgi:hypothetical protein